jgi:glycylpeptide N-tetradecanoyltransferase
MGQDEIAHHLLPRDEVMYTIVIENDKKQITDFVSFYNLPSQILKREGHNHTMMKVSYNFVNQLFSDRIPLLLQFQ